MPNSRATWAMGFPLVWASRTASRLNSCASLFWTFCMILFLPLEESILRFHYSTKVGEAHILLLKKLSTPMTQENHPSSEKLQEWFSHAQILLNFRTLVLKCIH